jgi:hypothetical protein
MVATGFQRRGNGASRFLAGAEGTVEARAAAAAT